MFITDAILTVLVTAALKKTAADMATLANGQPSYWPGLITDANLAAYNEIVGRLMARGFLKPQVDAWDRGVEVQSKIGLYWALTEGAALDGFDDKYIQKLERYFLGEGNVLDTCIVTAGGVTTDPQGQPGVVNVGPLNTSGDLFVMDPCDPRIGRVTRW